MQRSPASLWRRLAGCAIDLVAFFVPAMAVIIAVGELGWHVASVRSFVELGGLLFVFLAMAFCYEAVIPGLTAGWSPGRKLMGIQWVARDGRAASVWQCSVRFAVRIGIGLLLIMLDISPISLAPYVAAIVIEGAISALNPDRRSLGDFAAGTWTVQRTHEQSK